MALLLLFARLSQPLGLLSTTLLYALGVGVVRYLGASIDWGIAFVGLAWVMLVQLSATYVNHYYEALSITDPSRTPFSVQGDKSSSEKPPREIALWAGVACLTAAASLSIPLIRAFDGLASPFFMLAIFFLAMLYCAPPLRLSATGYGELVITLLIVNLTPAFAYTLQSGEMHRLLAMSTFPLTVLHLAMMLVLEFPEYAAKLKLEQHTLLIRLGWQNGVHWHNYLLLSGFAILGLAVLFGLPLQIALPAFFVLPLSLFQIWYLNRIADGARPNWTLLSVVALATFWLAAYLLTFSFWTR